jgi:NitT/TauT family transport system ATP-binding protein
VRNQNAPSCISIQDLSVVYRARRAPVHALAGVDLEIQDGEFVALLGATGCGKSTLLRAIGDLRQPTGGTVEVWGQPASAARRQNEFGFVFQEPALLPWRTAMGNVMLPLEVVDYPPPRRMPRCLELLELVGLTHFRDNYPYELSGGMKQRVAIVRALVWDPSILLMDEPFSALDELTRNQLQLDLLYIWDVAKKTIVFVTHNITEAVFLADRVVVMSARPGRVNTIIPVDLPRPRTDALRQAPEFFAHVRLAQEALKT